MIAGGRLSRIPIVKPISHPEHGISMRTTTKPIANRLKNAPRSAAGLSGNDIGSIIATVRRPKTRPHTLASMKRDILFFYGFAHRRGKRNRRGRGAELSVESLEREA